VFAREPILNVFPLNVLRGTACTVSPTFAALLVTICCLDVRPDFILWAFGLPKRLRNYTQKAKQGKRFAFLTIAAKHFSSWISSDRFLCKLSFLSIVRPADLFHLLHFEGPLQMSVSICVASILVFVPAIRTWFPYVVSPSLLSLLVSPAGDRLDRFFFFFFPIRVMSIVTHTSYGFWAAIAVCLVMDRRQGFSFRQTGLRILGTLLPPRSAWRTTKQRR